MAIIVYNEVKIDNRGRILLPKKLRDYLKDVKVTKMWVEQDTEQNQHYLRWKKGE